MSHTYYHYADANNQPVGPLSAEQLHALVKLGVVSFETAVWREGAPEWHPYRTMFPPPVVRQPTASSSQAATPPMPPGRKPWYKRTGWSILLLYFFPYIMLPLMWSWKLYTLRARVWITAAYASVVLLILAVGVSDSLSQKWEADRLKAQRVSAEAAVRREFAEKRGEILAQVKVAVDAQNYELAIHLGERYEDLHDPQLDNYLYTARAAQRSNAEAALRQDFEENREAILTQVKAAVEARDYERAIQTGGRYEAVHDYHLDNLLYIARDALKTVREQVEAARKAAEEKEKEIKAASVPISDWSNLTKAQWRNKAVHAFSWTPIIPLVAPAARFQQIMGRPNRTQTIGDEVYWYYECSDGTIQMVMDASVLQAMGSVQAQVNDY